MNVLAVDPGGTTGLAFWNESGGLRAWCEPADDAIAWYDARLHASEAPLDLVVFESFTLTQRSLKDTANAGLTIELIGVGRYLARRAGITFETQSPADAKSFATDAKLRAMDWWTRGVDHPRDATRHMLLALAKRRLVDLRQLVT